MKPTEIYRDDSGMPIAVREGADFDICESEVYTTPKKVFELAKAIGMTRRAEEYCYMCMFDTASHLIAFSEISHGTINGSFMHPREILQRALLCGAKSFILVHNHPSGNLSPSAQDLETTKHIKEAAKICGLDLLDHIIVTKDAFNSMQESTDIF